MKRLNVRLGLILPVVLFLYLIQVKANVLGTDAQTFNPTANGLSFVTVQSSQVLSPQIINLGLFANGASNTLSYLQEAQSQTLFNSRDRIYSLDLNAGMGIGSGWELSLHSPYLLGRENEGCQSCVFFKDPGFTETRLGIKNGNYQWAQWGFSWMLSFNVNRIENNPYAGQGSGPTTNVEFFFDRSFGKFNFAFNFGHRWRQIGSATASNSFVSRVPNQYIYSFGLSYFKENWDSNLIAELFGSQASQSFPDQTEFQDRKDKALEVLIGIKHQWTHKIALHTGLGREVLKGFGTPDLRVYVGINYSFGVTSPQKIELNQDNQKSFNLANMSFEFDSTSLTQSSEVILDEVSQQVAEMTSVQNITIEGHTDSLGDDNYNMKLSQDRAEYLKKRLGDYLVKQKKYYPIEAKGFGESQPVAPNTNFQGRAANRRVIIKVKHLQPASQ